MSEVEEIGPTPHAEAVRALLEERLARLGDARSTRTSPQDCAAADCVLRGMLALVRFALGDMDGVVELALAALDSAGQVLEAPEFDLDRVLAIQAGLNMATKVLQKSGAPAEWRRGEELVLVLVRNMMSREQVPTPYSIFQLGARTINVGTAQVREGDVEGGIATMREGLEVLLRLEAVGVASEMTSLWRANRLYRCASEVLPLDREVARAWTVEADGMIESDILGTPAESQITGVSPEIRALYVEFELGPPPYDRIQR